MVRLLDVAPPARGGLGEGPLASAATRDQDTLGARFDDTCRRYPGNLAVHDLSRKLTYRELQEWVARIRAAVVKITAPGDRIASLLHSDARAPAAALGVLTAGRALVALDADHPVERNRLIAQHAAVRAVVTTHALTEQARKLFDKGVAIINIDAVKRARAAMAAPNVPPDDLAWIIYTSGSTGTPKGVYQNHRGLLQDVLGSIVTIGLKESDRPSWFYALAVIAGLRSALGTLLAGATLNILPPRKLGAPHMAQEIRKRRITHFRASATLFRHVAGALQPGERLDDVQQVILGGDYVHWSDFDLFRKCCRPEARFACHLGSTECSTLFTHWYVDEAARADGPLMPVGYAERDRTVTLVDDEGNPVPNGETGEFVISGSTLALGYWREPELTRRAFSRDPHHPGIRTFRTGDLGRRRANGLYEFAGRKDHQIKLRGFRIELGEIEGALRSCPGVRDTAVIVRRNKNGTPRALVAYVQLQDGVKGLLPRHLKAMLDQRLPSHMTPADIVMLDELPWLPNFKVDRRALEARDGAVAHEPAAIADPLVAEVARAFETVLRLDRATPEDSLASLGGDSLQAVDIVLRLEKRLGVSVPQDVFRASRSIRELSAWIAARRPKGSGANVKPRSAQKARV